MITLGIVVSVAAVAYAIGRAGGWRDGRLEGRAEILREQARSVRR